MRSDIVTGILLMIGSMFFMTIIGVFVRLIAAEHLHPMQIVFLRNLAAFLIILPFALPLGKELWQVPHWKIHFWRSFTGSAAMLLWFYALAWMPLAQAVSLSFTSNLFATIGAALILKEVVHARRWTAIMLGFIGVIVMLRPFEQPLNPIAWCALLSSAFIGINTLLIKSLASRDGVRVILFYMGLFMVPMTLPTALMHWQPVSNLVWLYTAGMGVAATLAHVLLNKAFSRCETSVLLPFDFCRLPFAVFFAFQFFGEKTDVYTWIGASIIACSSIYVAYRETRLHKVVVPPAQAAP